MHRFFIAVSVFLFVAHSMGLAQETPDSLNEHLAALKPMLGKVWKGEFSNSTPEKPMFDVLRWERAMNGQAVRALHSVNEGVYGGETILMWDAKQKKIGYWYFTTAGFFTQGTMEASEKKWSSTEDVSGNANGITKVKSVMELLDNGDLHVKSEYFADGKWSPGHEVHYQPAADAKVVFK